MEKVFISSPVYDLIDIRFELADFFRKIGMLPVLSDSKEDGFELNPDVNSIESCLENVRSADYFVLVLSQRYGPSLEKAGFGDLSATHLEFKEALKAGKRKYVYFRDRLVADYTVWKKNDRKKLKLPWVSDKDHKLFGFIEEHSRLEKESKNWYQTFTSSIDLKEIVSKDFRKKAAKDSLIRNISEDKIPVFGCDITKDVIQVQGLNALNIKLKFKNVGSRMAHNVIAKNRFKEIGNRPIIAPGDSFFYNHIVTPGQTNFYEEYFIQYQDGVGNQVEDGFECRISGDTESFVKFSCKMKDRKYKVGEGVTLNIEE